MKGTCSQDHLRGIFTGIVTQIFQQYFFDRRKRFVAMGRQRETLVPRLFSLKLLMLRSKHDRRLLVRLTKFSTFYHRARKFIVRSGEHFYRRWKSIFRFLMYFLETGYFDRLRILDFTKWYFFQNEFFPEFYIHFLYLFISRNRFTVSPQVIDSPSLDLFSLKIRLHFTIDRDIQFLL